jgi:hemolysin activation/secretion protein
LAKSALTRGSCSRIAVARAKRHLSRLLLCAALAATRSPVYSAEDPGTAIGTFDIVRFEVDGSSRLSPQAIDKLLAPFAGNNRGFADVERAVQALQDAYHRQGLKLVQVIVPEQELNAGVVRLQVVETRIGKVVVKGNTVFDDANIRHSLPALREGETPDLDRVSASLKLANESPAKKTVLQLQNSDTPDEVDALVKITDEKAWKVGLTLDNTGNSQTGETRLGLLYQYANVGGLDHVASLAYVTSLEKPQAVSIYSVGYHIPLYASGDSIDLYGAYSNVDAGTVSAGALNLQVSGKGSAYGIRYNQNLGTARSIESKLVYGLDYRAYENDVALGGNALGNDVTVHPLSLTYLGKWNASVAETIFYIGALANVPGGSKGADADFDRARAGASAGYTLLRYGASSTLSLPRDWQVHLNLSGQYTDDLLVPGEQFGVGGATSVRGFQEREIAGDSGYVYNAELYTPDLCSRIKGGAAQCRALVFLDGARVTRNRPLPGEDSGASIGSVGVGLRMTIDRYISLRFDVAQVIDGGGSEVRGDWRAHFSIGVYY